MGRVDGEALERFWSYLRNFASITKEMTPSHRIDLLSDACIYYANRKINVIGWYYDMCIDYKLEIVKAHMIKFHTYILSRTKNARQS